MPFPTEQRHAGCLSSNCSTLAYVHFYLRCSHTQPLSCLSLSTRHVAVKAGWGIYGKKKEGREGSQTTYSRILSLRDPSNVSPGTLQTTLIRYLCLWIQAPRVGGLVSMKVSSITACVGYFPAYRMYRVINSALPRNHLSLKSCIRPTL